MADEKSYGQYLYDRLQEGFEATADPEDNVGEALPWTELGEHEKHMFQSVATGLLREAVRRQADAHVPMQAALDSAGEPE